MITSFIYCPECGVYTGSLGQDFCEEPCDICGYYIEPEEDDEN